MAQKSNLTIKVLSIVGGVLTVIFFLGLLALSSVLRPETSCLIIGSILIIIALFVNRPLTKPFLDAMNTMCYIAGCILAGYGMSRNIDVLFIVLIGVNVATTLLSKRFILIFLPVISFYMTLLGEIASLFSSLNPPNAAAVPIITVFLFVNLSEAKVLSYTNGDFSKYKPVHSGLFVSCVLSLAGLSVSYLTKGTNDWIISVFMLVGTLPVVYKIIQTTQVKSLMHRVCTYLLYILICLPSLYTPYLSDGVLLVLICFHYGCRTGSAVTLLLFIYSVFRYYYGLGVTLLTKSTTLFFTGIALLIVWCILTQKKTGHERIQPNTDYRQLNPSSGIL